MQALVVGDGRLSFRPDYPAPRPAAGEALLRVRLAGICSTDLEIVKGYANFRGVPGHEFVAQVEAADDESWVGRRVVGGINVGCGHCLVCRASGPEHCTNRTVVGIIGRDGAFADYLVLPAANLRPAPDDVPDELAVFTEPLAAALRIREQIAVRPAQAAAVVGPGKLGLLIGQVLALSGGRVTMLGRRPDSLALARELGLEAGQAAEAADDAFDLVVEATASPAGLAQALRLVRPQGTLVLKSTYAGRADVDLTKVVVGEINVVGSRCGPFEPALQLLAAGQIRVEPLIEAQYPLAAGVAAFEHAGRPGARKILLRPGEV
ncbi:MAG: MDR/zinc-dependent alcohol dehydrogenase-like family protein [Candidatus Promineifilaceae bacterium]